VRLERCPRRDAIRDVALAQSEIARNLPHHYHTRARGRSVERASHGAWIPLDHAINAADPALRIELELNDSHGYGAPQASSLVVKSAK
jgi:hypothetical protein